jgi:hypothetical protein
MRTELYWIQSLWPGRLAIMPRPRGGDWLEDEIESWRGSGVDVVLSLLTPDEIADLGLAEEARLCQANGIQFLSFPIPDRSVPASRKALASLLTQLAAQLAGGRNIAIHCGKASGGRQWSQFAFWSFPALTRRQLSKRSVRRAVVPFLKRLSNCGGLQSLPSP